MNAEKLATANHLQQRIDDASDWLHDLSVAPPLGGFHFHPMTAFTILTDEAQKRIRAIAKADIEVQLSQLKQEFESL